MNNGSLREFAKPIEIDLSPCGGRNQQADRLQMREFTMKHRLSARKPEITSLYCAPAFKQEIHKTLYNDLIKFLYNTFTGNDTNRPYAEKTGIHSLDNPIKVVDPRGKKQLKGLVAAERGQLVVLVCAIMFGEMASPMCMFPRKRFQIDFKIIWDYSHFHWCCFKVRID